MSTRVDTQAERHKITYFFDYENYLKINKIENVFSIFNHIFIKNIYTIMDETNLSQYMMDFIKKSFITF